MRILRSKPCIRFLLLYILSASVGLLPQVLSAETKPPANAFKSYNDFLLRCRLTYKNITQEESSRLSAAVPQADLNLSKKSEYRQEILARKKIINDRVIQLSNDIQTLSTATFRTPEVRKLHNELVAVLTQLRNSCRRALTTIGSKQQSNYDLAMKEVQTATDSYKAFAKRYQALCDDYGVSPSAVIEDGLRTYKD